MKQIFCCDINFPQFQPPSFEEAIFSDLTHETIGDHAVPISTVERDPVSGHDAMSIVRAMAEQDHHNLMINQPRSNSFTFGSNSDRDNLVNHEDMREFHTHVRGSGYTNQPSYSAAQYDNKEINRYADVYKYDWKEYEKNQRDLSMPSFDHVPSSLETTINSPEMSHSFEGDSMEDMVNNGEVISSSRRSSRDEGISSNQRPKQQVPPPTSPTDSSVSSTPTMTSSPLLSTRRPLPSSPGRQMIPSRRFIKEEVIEATTRTPFETTTFSSSNDFLDDNEISPNTISPIMSRSNIIHRHPSIFNNVITFKRQEHHFPPQTTTTTKSTPKITTSTATLTPVFIRDNDETTTPIPTTLSSISVNDEVMTASPPKFFIFNHIRNNQEDFSNRLTHSRLTRNQGVIGDEIIFETTTEPFAPAFRSSSSSQSPASSSSANKHNKVPPKESITDLIRLTSVLKKPIGLFRNKLVDKRVQERLTRRQEALSLKENDKKSVVIKFTG
jgi:hypothetical protein